MKKLREEPEKGSIDAVEKSLERIRCVEVCEYLLLYDKDTP